MVPYEYNLPRVDLAALAALLAFLKVRAEEPSCESSRLARVRAVTACSRGGSDQGQS
jgi:hypothetical protein